MYESFFSKSWSIVDAMFQQPPLWSSIHGHILQIENIPRMPFHVQTPTLTLANLHKIV